VPADKVFVVVVHSSLERLVARMGYHFEVVVIVAVKNMVFAVEAVKDTGMAVVHNKSEHFAARKGFHHFEAAWIAMGNKVVAVITAVMMAVVHNNLEE